MRLDGGMAAVVRERSEVDVEACARLLYRMQNLHRYPIRWAAATAERKREGRAQTGAVARNSILPRVSVLILARQHFHNTYVSNVPSPRAPLSLAGAPLLEIFPIVPLIGNLSLAVGALTYAGQFNVTAISDPACCPDVEVFAHGVSDTLQTLHASPSGNRATWTSTKAGLVSGSDPQLEHGAEV